VHLVLAKSPAEDGSLPAGSKALSLFIVPKILPDGSSNDIAVAGLNHKMGYRGTVNCLLNFGEKDGALGWRVGECGQGLRQMFQMMNEARIGVGIGAAALGYRGFRQALGYAQERIQGRLTGAGETKPVAIINHPDVKRMLLTQKAYAEGALALCLYCARLVDESAEPENAALLALLTPVAKTWSSEYGLAANDLAIQIHGGYGYTRDFDVEQLYRDNRLNSIHEGTTGIQALDLLGRKLLHDGESALTVLARRVVACCDRAATDDALGDCSSRVLSAWTHLAATVDELRRVPIASVLPHASCFLAAFGHVIVAWLWLEQAMAARRRPIDDGVDRDFLNGKVRACRFFIECELPRVEAWLNIVDSRSNIAAATSVAEF